MYATTSQAGLPVLAFMLDDCHLRVMLIDGEPWFVASDVCAALGISRTDDGVSRLDDDEKDTGSIRTLGGQQDMTIVNESGLYSLILGSRKPEAKRFKKWITAEVLPSIRKTGTYSAKFHSNDLAGKRLAQSNTLSLRRLARGLVADVAKTSCQFARAEYLRQLTDVNSALGWPVPNELLLPALPVQQDLPGMGAGEGGAA